MKRRTYLQTMVAGTTVMLRAAPAADTAHPIQLHVDLSVDPTKEKEMLRNFETTFRPAASKQRGYIDAKMLKLRSTLVGTAPAGAGSARFLKTDCQRPGVPGYYVLSNHAFPQGVLS